jgi:hypothetical protein
MLNGLRIVSVPSSFLDRVRAGTDDLGQAVEAHTAQGGEPLRDCLRRARPGEAIVLASFCPFSATGPYREYGPVFIAAAPQAVEPLDSWPFAGAPPYLAAPFVLRAYSREQRIVDAVLSSPASASDDAGALFAHAHVAFVLARFAAYGCYALRLERA